MTTPEKPKGPASYFPSIEHGMGHGHANAIVAYWMATKN